MQRAQGQERSPKDHPRQFLKSDHLQAALRFFFFWVTTMRPEVGLPLSKMAESESLLISKGTSRNDFKREGKDCARVRVHATGRGVLRARVGG